MPLSGEFNTFEFTKSGFPLHISVVDLLGRFYFAFGSKSMAMLIAHLISRDYTGAQIIRLKLFQFDHVTTHACQSSIICVDFEVSTYGPMSFLILLIKLALT